MVRTRSQKDVKAAALTDQFGKSAKTTSARRAPAKCCKPCPGREAASLSPAGKLEQQPSCASSDGLAANAVTTSSIPSAPVCTEPSLDLINAADSQRDCHSPTVATGSPCQPQDCAPEVAADTSPETTALTSTMIEEEKKLTALRLKEDEQERQQAQKEWNEMTSDLKEERFQKLQGLLKKSSLYTSYLVKRIRGQGYGQPSSEASEQPAGTATPESVVNSGATPILFTGGSLRNYQKDGFLWLNALYENGVNGILADEMGLGKTIQCIAAVSHLVSMDVGGPYLIVAPLSTLPNWVGEFQRFSPKIPVIMYHGTKEERLVLRHKIRRTHVVDGRFKTQPVVVTSYEISMKDRKDIMNFHWKYLIVDEGHRIKNVQCRLTRELRMYNTTHRLLLTGTPLQNNLAELWSLLHFLLPEIFDDLESFESWFQLDTIGNDDKDQLVAEERKRNILTMFHQILTPFLLRRLKADVDLNLPPKKEVVVPAHLTDSQKNLYQAVVDKSIESLLDPSKAKGTAVPLEEDAHGRSIRKAKKRKVDYSVMLETKETESDESLDTWLSAVAEATDKQESCESESKSVRMSSSSALINILMQLRKVCNHPYLISFTVDKETGWYKVDEKLVEVCGKMQVLDRLLRELHSRKHKVLLFSQMTRMLDIIEDFCALRKYKYCRLDGSTRVDDRRSQIGTFNNDSEYFIFLLSTRAGGLGINLTAADTVIIYDSDWNPQCDMQAQDRCHRIGQTRPVVVYRLICPGTVDEKMVEKAALKRRLEQMVIHREQFKMGLHTNSFSEAVKPITAEELLQLMKATDYQKAGRDKGMLSQRELKSLLDRSDLIAEWERCKNSSGDSNATAGSSRGGGDNSGFGGIFKTMDSTN